MSQIPVDEESHHAVDSDPPTPSHEDSPDQDQDGSVSEEDSGRTVLEWTNRSICPQTEESSEVTRNTVVLRSHADTDTSASLAVTSHIHDTGRVVTRAGRVIRPVNRLIQTMGNQKLLQTQKLKTWASSLFSVNTL